MQGTALVARVILRPPGGEGQEQGTTACGHGSHRTATGQTVTDTMMGTRLASVNNGTPGQAAKDPGAAD